MREGGGMDVLEVGVTFLTAGLDFHLDTSEHLFCSALVVDSELDDIAVLLASPFSCTGQLVF